MSDKSDFNLEKVLEQIKIDYSEERVCAIYDDEILNWIDRESMEIEGYDDEYEWYWDFNNGEAQNVVIEEIIQNWSNKYNNKKKLDTDSFCALYDVLKYNYHLN